MKHWVFIPFFFLTLLAKAQEKVDSLSLMRKRENACFIGYNNGRINPKYWISELDAIEREFKQFKNHPNYFDIYRYKGSCYYILKDFDATLREYQRGIDRCDILKGTAAYDSVYFKLNSEIAWWSTYQIKNWDYTLNQFKRTYDFLQTHPTLHQKIPVDVMFLYSNYAKQFQRMGDKEQYFSMLFNTWVRFKNYNDAALVQVLSNLCNAYIDKGDYENAFKFSMQTLLYAKDSDDFSRAYNAIAIVYKQKEKYKKSIESFNLALNYLKKTATKSLELEPAIKINLGEIFFKQKKYSLAKKYFNEALQLQSKLDSPLKNFRVAKIYIGLGDVEAEQFHTQNALEYYQKAIIASHKSFSNIAVLSNPAYLKKDILSPFEFTVALSKKAALLSKINLQKSLETSLLAIDFASKIRKSLQSQESKVIFIETIFHLYEHALETALQLYQKTHKQEYAENFFTIVEASNSGALLDILNKQSFQLKSNNKEYSKKANLYNQQINVLQSQISATNDKNTKEQLKSQVAELSTKLNIINDEFEKKEEKYLSVKYKNQLISLTEAQKSIAMNGALISYFVSNDLIYAIAITNNQFKLLKIPASFELKQNVNLLYEKVSYPNGIKLYDGHLLAKNLYDTLLKPFENLLANKSQLLVVRTNFLSLLPFEVLERQGNSDYLVKAFSFAYLSSATNFFWKKNFLTAQDKIFALAPFNKPSQELATRSKLQALPASENEVMAITSDYLLSKKANKQAFFKHFNSANILHFATHAQTDDEENEKSFIGFYPQDSNYKIELPEIYRLDLNNTKLIVLSACETAKGKLTKGEGLLSLARAFQFAGCPSVVATAWSADDNASAILSQLFYKNLEKGLSFDEALQAAKIEMISSKKYLKYDHPFYWSNMFLFGQSNKVFIQLPNNNSSNYWLWSIFSLSFFSIIYFNRRTLLKRWNTRNGMS